MDVTVEDRTFRKEDLAGAPLPKGVYESCTFEGCDFSGADLARLRLIGCVFEGCNLSLARIDAAAFRDVVFRDCKMLGLPFHHCGGFGQSFRFERCLLDHASFHGLPVARTVFQGCRLHEVDFSAADLTGASFAGCDLTGAVFDRTVLEKADLRTAVGYSIDPERNRLKKAKVSLSEVAGLLGKYGLTIDPRS